jgi:hypothetical protein
MLEKLKPKGPKGLFLGPGAKTWTGSLLGERQDLVACIRYGNH